MQSEGYKRKVDIGHELLSHPFHAAADIKKSEKSTPPTHDLRTWFAKCVEVDAGFFEHLLRTVTNS